MKDYLSFVICGWWPMLINSILIKPIRQYSVTVLILLLLFTACSNDEQTKQFAQKQSHLSDNLVAANKDYVKEESREIDNFIKQHGYEMQKSETGLRYKIESGNKGEKAVYGDLVTLKYKIFLLNGILCYSNDSSGLMSFKVDQEDIPNGIQEAVQLMRKGDKAQLVMPAHLAYGLSGDQHKIPLQSPLFCELELIQINKK